MANRPKTVTQALLFVEILSLLPTRRWMDLDELLAALALKGLFVSKLTLQRAMKTLREAEGFGIECDQRARPFGYRLRARPAFADFERIVMNPDMALLLKLVETYLCGLLPGHLLYSLEAHFEAADRCLARESPASRQSAAWLRKVALSPADPFLPSPSIAPRILKTVSEALYCGHKLEIAFEPTFGSTETLVVSPLGLVHGHFRIWSAGRTSAKGFSGSNSCGSATPACWTFPSRATKPFPFTPTCVRSVRTAPPARRRKAPSV